MKTCGKCTRFRGYDDLDGAGACEAHLSSSNDEPHPTWRDSLAADCDAFDEAGGCCQAEYLLVQWAEAEDTTERTLWGDTPETEEAKVNANRASLKARDACLDFARALPKEKL